MRRDADGTREGLTRRDFFKRSAVTMIPMLLTTAPGQAAVQPVRNIRRGGTLVASSIWTYPSLDPHLSTMGVNLIGFDALYNNLVRLELVDAKTWEHKVVGDLAESWEQPDSSTLIFALKSGITFQDGTPFTAEVAAWNILRARDHPKSFLKTPLADIASAEAIDRKALRVKLKKPNADRKSVV